MSEETGPEGDVTFLLSRKVRDATGVDINMRSGSAFWERPVRRDRAAEVAVRRVVT